MDVAAGAVAVIFTSLRRMDASTRLAADADAYAEMAEVMNTLASAQPGFLGMESVRDPASLRGITVSYWVDDSSAQSWKQVSEHLVAQRRGREDWYDEYSVVVAEVTRAYRHPAE